MAFKKMLGVFGSGSVEQGSQEWELARRVGRRAAEAGLVVLTGGLGGVMAAACQGAREAGGLTIGILPGDRQREQPNRFVDIAVFTGMGEARNVVNVKSCHAAVVVGGEYGTLSEVALALKLDCPLVFLEPWELRRGGERLLATAAVARSPEEAVDWACMAMEAACLP